jgi:predicted kinase
MSAEGPLRRGEALHLQIARSLRTDIEAGVLRDGQALPSTRQLAARWSVSDYTVSEAMKVLQAEGVVQSKSRSMRVVVAPDQPPVPLATTSTVVILIGGYAGTGKSELGRILSRQTRCALIDKDTITRPVVELALETMGLSANDRESGDYLARVRPREYEALYATIRENVECRNSVIATAPFIRELTDPAWMERARSALGALGAAVFVVWVHCDADTMHSYIRHRGAARDGAKLADWTAYVNQIDPDLRPVGESFVVENSASSRPLREQADRVVAWLSKTAGNG